MSTCFGLVVIEAQTHSRKNLHLLYHLFSLYMLAIIPLTGGMTDVVVPTACTGYWVGPPLCSMVVIGPLQGRVCSLVAGPEGPRYVSALWCEAGGTGSALGDEPPGTPPLVLPTGVHTVMSPVTCCAGSPTTALSPTSVMGMIPAISLVVPQARFSQDHQCRSLSVYALKSGMSATSVPWMHIGSYGSNPDPGLALSLCAHTHWRLRLDLSPL